MVIFGLRSAAMYGTLTRGWRPHWTRKILGRRVDSLNVLRTMQSGEQTEVGRLVPADDDIEAIALSRATPKLTPGLQALEHLSPLEREVVWCAACGMPWTNAAVTAGLSKDDGHPIHRKAKRLTRQFRDRQIERERTLSESGASW
jgi:hypothetical protein